MSAADGAAHAVLARPLSQCATIADAGPRAHAAIMATTLLVAIDFEDASRRAIDLAKDLAKPLGAALVIVHVYTLPVYTYPGLEPSILPGFQGEITAAARGALASFAADVGIPDAVLREGDPAAEILAVARERRASMIIMGTHGRRGFAHTLLGSVAEKIIRHSEIPVLTVRGEAV
ncbi:Universal stress protein family protein [Minicystis rosea]|nr:Universal stress protein family protein [Minicystis rosea]